MKASVKARAFGSLHNENDATLYTLSNANGVQVAVTNFGAALVSYKSPDRNGRLGDIVLGFDSAEAYKHSDAYIGATVGRFANRISEACFYLNDVKYELSANAGVHHLHGGQSGFNSRIWHAAVLDTEGASVRFSLFSPDGDQGYPGNLTVHTVYTLNNANQLTINIYAKSDADTPVSITNHSYFNLAGSGPIDDHLLSIFSDTYTPIDQEKMPTGELCPVANTPFDFRSPQKVGERLQAHHEQIKFGEGLDHNFMTQAARTNALAPAARLEDQSSGRILNISTTAPGIQVYTANFLESAQGKGVIHQPRHAICLEPQHVPNSPNRPEFPSSILKAGEQYRHTMILETSVK